jgi:agmatinase
MTQVKVLLPAQGSTMFGAPACKNIEQLTADVAFLGFPYEHGQLSFLPGGQKWGPKALREQVKGYQYRGCYGGTSLIVESDEEACGWYDPDLGKWQMRGVTMADCGDVNILPAEGESSGKLTNFGRLTEAVKQIVARGAFPVVMGGEHTLTFPIVQAFETCDALDIVQFDAHLDFTDSVAGTKINNMDCMKRCSELPFVKHITQIGINPRSRWSPRAVKAYEAAKAYGSTIITANKFRQLGVSQVIDTIPRAKHIYVTIDIDCLDCVISPGISGQEPAGLTVLDVSQVLSGIASRGQVVGFDVNGLIPSRDPTGITARVVLTLMEDFLAAIFSAEM